MFLGRHLGGFNLVTLSNATKNMSAHASFWVPDFDYLGASHLAVKFPSNNSILNGFKRRPKLSHKDCIDPRGLVVPHTLAVLSGGSVCSFVCFVLNGHPWHGRKLILVSVGASVIDFFHLVAGHLSIIIKAVCILFPQFLCCLLSVGW